jgi:hypothetical protein
MAANRSNSSTSNAPAFVAYHVQDREDKPSFW